MPLSIFQFLLKIDTNQLWPFEVRIWNISEHWLSSALYHSETAFFCNKQTPLSGLNSDFWSFVSDILQFVREYNDQIQVHALTLLLLPIALIVGALEAVVVSKFVFKGGAILT